MVFATALWPLGALYLVFFAAASDLRTMRIPNWVSVALVVLFIAGIPFGLHPHLQGHLIVFAISSALLCALFFANLIGGGDTKLLAALSLWVGPYGLVPFLLVMSLVGGLMGALALLLIKSKKLEGHTYKNPDSWLARLSRGEKTVSYGVAIAAGFIAALTKIYL
jgi:prepilin peptidase CpaA